MLFVTNLLVVCTVLNVVFYFSVVWTNICCLTVACRKVDEHLEKFSRQMHFQLMCFRVDKH